MPVSGTKFVALVLVVATDVDDEGHVLSTSPLTKLE